MSDVMKPDYISDADWHILVNKYSNLEEVIDKLNKHYPVQYLIGNVPFLNTTIKVDERCLIPRFETEYLVDEVIKMLKEYHNLKILDLGSGSGCIGIALKKNLDAHVTCVDISEDAISLAKENALLNHVDINFINKSMFDISYEDFDVIISNPPYVRCDEEVGLETKYEPSIALYASNNGLYFYEEIIKRISKLKNKPMLIAFEIGCEQASRIESFVKKMLSDYNFLLKKDLAGKDRYIYLKKCEKNDKKTSKNV